MASTGNGGTNEQPAENEIQKDVHIYEDEINFMGYFLVLWKHKWFILVCSILPALIVGVCIHLSPRSYMVTYTYDVMGDVMGDDVMGDDVIGDASDYERGYERGYARSGLWDNARNDISNWNLNEKNFNVLQSKFYSEGNIKRIVGKLKNNGLDEYAQHIENFKADASQFVKFAVSPPFVDISKSNVTNPDQLEKIRDMEALLLNMTIIASPKEGLEKIALAVRNNFEEVMSLYMVQDHLSAGIRNYNNKLADIENTRFSVELAIKNNTDMLGRLKRDDVAKIDKEKNNVAVQFNVGGQSQYLPLSYQIQALESEIVKLQGKINTGTANYKYYEDLLGVNTKIVAELNDKLSSIDEYTIEQFKSFLTDLVVKIEKQELKDYLASYIKKIENSISASIPVSKTPKTVSILKGTVKKSCIVFAIALVMSVFASFLREGLKKTIT